MPYIDSDIPALTEEQKQFWLEHGYIKIPQCFSREKSDAFTSTVWTRLGADPNDKSTWPPDKMNMPGHSAVSAKEFAPKAWAAMCELVGGEEKVSDWCRDWKDGWIVNLGKPEFKPEDPLEFRTLDNWHNDGDWFTHFLDSPEQALLVIPLFSDIKPKGGGTVLCTDGIKLVAERLYDHPQGMTPFLMPRGSPDIPKTNPERRRIWREWATNPAKTRDASFVEATGEIGDVYILHPFMLHSASRNLRRDIRIITNPPVSLKEPFNYDGKNPSLVEKKTLRDLGHPEGIPDWKITEPRERIIPDRVREQMAMKQKELERLKAQGVALNSVDGAKEHTSYYPS
ncbi:hypothetical protein LTR78_003764 [Recurvomyces mirabilis]|uniref:Phytanoyl-CoA dioxygenase n=1 Tax=Recurvomyces mirabilis TaxID=574656 RepID=A0AAE0WR48_9PEZI|nr:hypothetical protein LTR78_003764 [Recurvomyces mirabilis]KAK5154876.1 hypothetical protein LTS14_006457 [Recurvomyces mirabilis]